MLHGGLDSKIQLGASASASLIKIGSSSTHILTQIVYCLLSSVFAKPEVFGLSKSCRKSLTLPLLFGRRVQQQMHAGAAAAAQQGAAQQDPAVAALDAGGRRRRQIYDENLWAVPHGEAEYQIFTKSLIFLGK